jgi:protein phosphatase 1 regulatory subunit 14B
MNYRNPFKKAVGFYEVSMATSYTTSPTGNSDSSYSQAKQMESYPPKAPPRTTSRVSASEKSSPKGVSVNFDTKEKSVEKREKYLTAKYGSHQMLLIKKRLAVEMWVFEELARLYCTEVSVCHFVIDIN